MASKEQPATTKTPDLLPPSYDYLIALQTELERRHGPEDTQIDRLRAVRENKQPSGLSDDLKIVDVEVRDPTVADEGQRVASMLGLNPAKCTVTPNRKGDKAEENATLREHFSEELFRLCGSRAQGMDTANAVVDAAVNDGASWSKFVLTKDTWEARYALRLEDYTNDYEQDADGKPSERIKKSAESKYDEDTEAAKKAAGPPFSWISVDVRTLYPVWSGNRLMEVLEVQTRPALTTFREYRLRRDNNGDIVSDETGQGTSRDQCPVGSAVVVLEHWDRAWCTWLVVGKNNVGASTSQVVKQFEHGYGRVPHFFAPGLWMSHWRNRKVGWGVSEAKRWLVEYRSYLWTLHAQVAARDVLTPLFRERAPNGALMLGGDGKPKAAEKWRLGEIIEGDPGEKLIPLAFPQTAAALKEQIAIVSEAIERLESPRVSGQIGGLEGAGFAMSQVLAELRTRHDPIAQSIERMYAELTRFAWHLIRTCVQEPVWIQQDGDAGWLGAAPEDLTDTVGVKWKLDPERPSAKVIEARYWHERMQAGTASNDQAIEAMGDNPDEVRIGRSLDRIRAGPWYTKQFDLHVAQESGMGDLLEEAMEIAKTGALPGQQMGPGGMGNELVPDLANLAQAPNGAGAVPEQAGPMGNAPGNGVNMGVGPGATMPQQAATAGIQRLVG